MAGAGMFESNRPPVLARGETQPLVTLARAPYLPPRCSRSSLKLMNSHSAGEHARYPPLTSKYAVTHVTRDAKMRKVTAVYGTMPVVLTTHGNNNDDHDRPEQDEEEDPALVSKIGKHSPLSNQSETESDSDGSSSTNPATLLQSILRIRPDGLAACRTTKKQASVEFVLDIDDYDDYNSASHQKKKARGSRFSVCAARCMPR